MGYNFVSNEPHHQQQDMEYFTLQRELPYVNRMSLLTLNSLTQTKVLK